MYEVTFCFVKPQAYLVRSTIRKMLIDTGLEIALEKDPYEFTPETARNQYQEHKSRRWYDKLIEKTLEGPATALYILKGEDATRRVVDIAGDTDPNNAAKGTIRRKFGDPANIMHNAIHRADSYEAVLREVYIHFTSEELAQDPDVVRILEHYKVAAK